MKPLLFHIGLILVQIIIVLLGYLAVDDRLDALEQNDVNIVKGINNILQSDGKR